MAGQADAHPPLGRAAEATSQIESAVRFIREHTGAARISIVAHSWGTLPAGRFAATRGELVEGLVLFGPLVDRHGPPQEEPEAPTAFTEIGREAQRASFNLGVPQGTRPPFDDTDFKAWADLYFAAGHGGVVRVPSGPLADAADADRGVLPYAPEAIRAPTLLVRGSWDAVSTADDVESLLDRLGAPRRLAITLAGGTHRMHLEPARRDLFRAVDAFLEEIQ
jgi:pimeloyl-ACP methyl ester carboxylesterase